MKYNLKEQLFDKIGGLELVNPDEYGAKYNKGVREAKARVVSFFNKELISGGFSGVFNNPMFEVKEVE